MIFLVIVPLVREAHMLIVSYMRQRGNLSNSQEIHQDILSTCNNLLYHAVRFANFEGILGFSVPSIILADLLGL